MTRRPPFHFFATYIIHRDPEVKSSNAKIVLSITPQQLKLNKNSSKLYMFRALKIDKLVSEMKSKL